MQRKARKSVGGSSSSSQSIIAHSITNDSGIILSDIASSCSENASVKSLEATVATSVDRTKSTLKLRSLKRASSERSRRPREIVGGGTTRVRKKPRRQYMCNVCSKNFLGSSDLRKHSRIHTDERPFACEKCSRRFRQLISLKNHVASIHGTDQKFACEQCKKSFPLKERLKLHMRIHSGEKPYSCSQCTKTFARGGTLRQHIICHHGTKKFKCLECPTSFASLNNLRLHMKIHLNVLEKRLPIVPTTKGKEFHCKVCNKTLKGHLLQHMKSHENIRSHTCNICSLQFSQKSHLNVHQRMHSGERPYRCRVCWQAFGHSSVLRLHIRKHTGEKPFKCLICSERGVAFSQLPHLKNHMKVIHGKDKPYMCEACQEFFKTKNELKIHMDSECIKTSPEDSSSQTSQNDEEVALSRLRLLVAILIKRISTEERLKQLGFEKRLIDNVVISALKLAKRKCHETGTMNEIDRFRLNIEEFLEWTIPENFMIKFREEKKSIDDLLEELATSFSKPTTSGGVVTNAIEDEH